MRPAWEAAAIEDREPPQRTPGREEIWSYHLADERRVVGGLIERAVYTDDERQRIFDLTRHIVEAARRSPHARSEFETQMARFTLDTDEARVLFSVLDVLLRLDNSAHTDALLADRLGIAGWPTFAKGDGDEADLEALHTRDDANNLALSPAQRLMARARQMRRVLMGRQKKGETARHDATGVADEAPNPLRSGDDPLRTVDRLVAVASNGVTRASLRRTADVIAQHLQGAATVQEGLKRAAALQSQGFRIDLDLAQPPALNEQQAASARAAVHEAIETIARACAPTDSDHPDVLMERPSLSISLPALWPRFAPARAALINQALAPELRAIAQAARNHAIPLILKADTQAQTDMTLALFAMLFEDEALRGWSGLGLTVQAYGKRALPILRWLRRLSARESKRIPVRLVKGYDWDNEIAAAQDAGLRDYPVFTRKLHTDLSYLTMLRLALSEPQTFYPMIATHAPHAIATAHVVGGTTPFEFQLADGLGNALGDELAGSPGLGRPTRVALSIGARADQRRAVLRKALERAAPHGALAQMANANIEPAALADNPVTKAERAWQAGGGGQGLLPTTSNVRPLAQDSRRGIGVAPGNPEDEQAFLRAVEDHLASLGEAGPIIAGVKRADADTATIRRCPHDLRQRIGTVTTATADEVDVAVAHAVAAAPTWDRRGGERRADQLERVAALFERDKARLVALMVRETGMTVPFALHDVRHAIDLAHRSAQAARAAFGSTALEGAILAPAAHHYRSQARRGVGPIACLLSDIQPLSALAATAMSALVAGNPVIVKPGPRSTLTMAVAVELMLEAGIPAATCQLLTGPAALGGTLVAHASTAGVVMTGRTATAAHIAQALAMGERYRAAFVAHDGGLNALIADASADPHQVAQTAIETSFAYAGQSCQATRAIFVDERMADQVCALIGTMIETLRLGDPLDPETDIGPVLSELVQDEVEAHKMRLRREAREIIDLPEEPHTCIGTFVTPGAFEVETLQALPTVMHGPVVHVLRYQASRLREVCEALNEHGYHHALHVLTASGATLRSVREHANARRLIVNGVSRYAAPLSMAPHHAGDHMAAMTAMPGSAAAIQAFTYARQTSFELTTGADGLPALLA
ncbi:MAG: proline dehydrogenase family protein [Pseudomonadota bacterium]